jgi:predicted S18 family serine protease
MQINKVPFTIFAAAILCLVVGCASVPPPIEQMAVTKLAITNAMEAGSAEYAAGDLRAAQEKMTQANTAMTQEDYPKARWLAEQAQADARLAEKKSQAAKAQRAAATTAEDSRVLREELNRKTK